MLTDERIPAWYKLLNSNLRNTVKKLSDVQKVEAYVLRSSNRYYCDFEDKRGIYVIVKIICRDGSIARGASICSLSDKFDLREGLKRAFGRAIKAYTTKECSLPKRCSYDAFPNTWSKASIRNVIDAPFVYKSAYIQSQEEIIIK